MFFVTNKDKIISVVVALSTVVILFLLATTFNNSNIQATVPTVAISKSKLLPIYSVDTQKNNISITINCAWNADDIDKILEVLNKCNVKVTFFMVGDWVDKFPEAVKKINESGNGIANHSNTHPHVNNLTLEKNIEEIEECSNKIKNITGAGTSLYRGPYGEYNDTVINAANKSNHISIQWNIDSLDYKGLTGEQMWERIEPKLSKGSIILMHNGTENTALSLEMIINKIKEKGYNIVPVSELIYTGNYTIDINGVQHSSN